MISTVLPTHNNNEMDRINFRIPVPQHVAIAAQLKEQFIKASAETINAGLDISSI